MIFCCALNICLSVFIAILLALGDNSCWRQLFSGSSNKDDTLSRAGRSFNPLSDQTGMNLSDEEDEVIAGEGKKEEEFQKIGQYSRQHLSFKQSFQKSGRKIMNRIGNTQLKKNVKGNLTLNLLLFTTFLFQASTISYFCKSSFSFFYSLDFLEFEENEARSRALDDRRLDISLTFATTSTLVSIWGLIQYFYSSLPE